MKKLPYFLMLMKLWLGDWEEHLDRMNEKVYEENRRGGTQENGRFRNLRLSSREKLWKNIGCLISAPNFGLGGEILW